MELATHETPAIGGGIPPISTGPSSRRSPAAAMVCRKTNISASSKPPAPRTRRASLAKLVECLDGIGERQHQQQIASLIVDLDAAAENRMAADHGGAHQRPCIADRFSTGMIEIGKLGALEILTSKKLVS
jgi:hypothetical protein